MIGKAVVPVAGLGTRMMPATLSIPKEMLPLGRKPVIEHIVEELHACGLGEILFVTRRGKQSIEDYFDSDTDFGQYSGPDFFYIRQQNPKGLGDAVLTARKFLANESFAVANGDSIIFEEPTEERLLHAMTVVHDERGADAVIAVEAVPPERTSRYGIIAPKSGCNGTVIEVAGVVEKPAPAQAPSNLAISARYIFSPRIFDALQSIPLAPNGELYLSDAIAELARSGGRVFAVLLGPRRRRYDIGSFDSYYRAFVDFALRDDKFGGGFRDYIRKAASDFR